jgi:hypothetical protein
VVNGPRRSPSLIMIRNNMDLRCFPCINYIRMKFTHKSIPMVNEPGVVFVLVMVI